MSYNPLEKDDYSVFEYISYKGKWNSYLKNVVIDEANVLIAYGSS